MRESLSTMTGWVAKRKARFMRWPPIAWFWRIYGVCAMQRIWTQAMVLIAFLSRYGCINSAVDLLNPVPVIEKMDCIYGTLVSFYRPLRTSHDTSLRVRTADGEIHKFRDSIYPEEKRLLATKIGKPVTVWSRPTYEAWLPYFYQKFWYVEFEGGVLIILMRIQGQDSGLKYEAGLTGQSNYSSG